ncbi:carbon-nitrogen hydrolase family protein [Oceanibacterium hippocampi]|uniref:2-oxoglutaramate amidase n=1 Tax=Oceanibacterium hippocampi TaxID=745714 RepID=A0A1Y5R679_9PROT|nr:carbon-nitrogen hydrolase family protein [Oceanibacterium hippocampi]SLN10211.1 2-oxoglutaramate amidase [Oceanibacterium hippocampi]
MPDQAGQSFTAACVQINGSADWRENLEATSALIREAKLGGADLVATPEVTNMLGGGRRTREEARPQDDDPSLASYRTLAAELKIWLLLGSLTLKKQDDERLANRSFLIGPDGAIAASYDKIHMFDVALENGETHRESKNFAPGDTAVLADLPWGRLGLSVCYDVRFPHLYRRLAKGGADILSVPAAFTRTTGEAHWHVLLRARAIENGAFVIAPAQCGSHADGRQTYGHSLIVAPWGEVLADGGTEPGLILATIETGEIGKARRRVPSLENDRAITGPAERPTRAAE